MAQRTDVNNDHLPDVVGFANAGVYVALNTGTGFQTASRWNEGFGYNNGWRVESHPRTLVDVNNDNLPDVVGFANAGVYVALNTGTGFQPASRWNEGFGYNNGWRVESHPRTLVDVNNDNLPDVVGFANAGVYVALNTGTGFQPASRWNEGFGYTAGGWRVESHPRTLVDVNNDNLPDVVGFASSGVYVALNTRTGFQPATRWIDSFGYTAGGWRVAMHPRMLGGD
ncbi:MAG: VCBS repeat-containing protein [Actinomycetota bacterium]|nr:VCBS repeat-containing protein [Actinomycetota bacterium]